MLWGELFYVGVVTSQSVGRILMLQSRNPKEKVKLCGYCKDQMGKKASTNIKLGTFDELWCTFMLSNDLLKIATYVLGKL